ncbi:GNAT family N-acetyltransferase [Catenulispora sp. NF23]|uniref:GNAT family N-acetyltransferase n=1 Tax=Catenulispora pinistramenti TaxID=2705254 RepID=A0ABS5KTA0_9ACTN|nr:GNAT family N-acetyltransferase [Catenulispora pinistramenti]MBS2537704.1 GNAT family N-acetyltransferase [Catenulispora pinistramenti]MBS2549235.1 GNAT family N-acetyltransferase [Catenulispora pinistramenti]
MIVPANEASWSDLQAILKSANCHGCRCYCQRFKSPGSDWRTVSDEERAFRLQAQTSCGDPKARTTSGLVAYRDGEPVGWVSVEPRTGFGALRRSRVPWQGRDEDKDDSGVWAVTCFHTRPGHRKQGVAGELAKATVPFARERGAKALEAYPMVVEPGDSVPWGETHVGTKTMFEDCGFVEVSRPTLRRVVMRIDF